MAEDLPAAPIVRRRTWGIWLAVALAIALCASGTLLVISRTSLSNERHELESARSQLARAQDQLRSAQSTVEEQATILSNTQSELNQATKAIRSYKRRLTRIHTCVDHVLDAYNLNEFYADVGRALEDALFSQDCGGTEGIPY